MDPETARPQPAIKRSDNGHRYRAGLEIRLHEIKARLILEARGRGAAQA